MLCFLGKCLAPSLQDDMDGAIDMIFPVLSALLRSVVKAADIDKRDKTEYEKLCALGRILKLIVDFVRPLSNEERAAVAKLSSQLRFDQRVKIIGGCPVSWGKRNLG